MTCKVRSHKLLDLRDKSWNIEDLSGEMKTAYMHAENLSCGCIERGGRYVSIPIKFDDAHEDAEDSVASPDVPARDEQDNEGTSGRKCGQCSGAGHNKRTCKELALTA